MRYYLVDTFADTQHLGNPAGVVPLPAFPDDDVMQEAAHRIGVPTTAFVVRVEPGDYHVRWFTPFAEVNLCGHATIGSAGHLYAQAENAALPWLRFESRNGVLYARRLRDLIALDLPKPTLTACPPPPDLLAALDVDDVVSCAVSHDDVLVEVASVDAVAAAVPDFASLAHQPFRGHIVTAAATSDVDFVSRTFFPALGVDEDQVCVTAHAKLAPFWAGRLGRSVLTARQLSRRGGRLEVENRAGSVRVLGSAVRRGGGCELALDGVMAPRRTTWKGRW